MSGNGTVMTAEDRLAVHDIVARYFAALDIERDLEAVLDCFTPDGILDYSDLGVAVFRGPEEMRGFFTAVLANSLWQIHLITNFHVKSATKDAAKAGCYLIGKAHHRGGNPIEITGGCDVECARVDGEWKISRIREFPVVPLDGPVANDLSL